LDATIEIGDDGILTCAEDQPIVVRDDLAKPKAGRAKTRREIATFFTIADVQLADEESPARGEWADKCEEHPLSAAFRPQEAMVPHLMNAHVLAANEIAKVGGPVLKGGFNFAVMLGDLADNQQYNELRAIIDIFDGGQLVDPDSGEDGYDGVQGSDPRGAGGETVESPIEGESLLDVANEPFWATGLRLGGKRMPWYTLPGNHDIKTQGTIPDDNPAWRAFIRQWVIGNIKVMDIAPDHQQELCDNPAVFSSPEFWMKVLTNPGTTKIVPADPDRRMIDRSEWIEEHSKTTGIPVGHGYLPVSNRCSNEDGEPLERACWSRIDGDFHYIGLDTAASEGRETGNLDPPQFRWLERELMRSSRTYFDADGNKQTNNKGSDKLIVVISHHTIDSTTNDGTVPGTSNARDGQDVRELLLRFPNMILQASGHTHQNKIWAHTDEDLGTGYWEVNNSAVVDSPHQSRTIEIADNRDGTLSIFGVVFDAFVPPDHRTMDWHGHDHTDEVALGGADRSSNEDWLASVAREVGFHDPQADLTKIGEPKDRNVELLLRAPFQLQGSGAGGGGQGKSPGEGEGGAGQSGPGGGSGGGSGQAGSDATAAERPGGSVLALTGVALLAFILAAVGLIGVGVSLRSASRSRSER
jgi:metallophosphoesterase (TIGR03767 family)